MGTPRRLEAEHVLLDGPRVRITHLGDDPDVQLEFKREQSASAAHRAIRNYLEVADVEPRDETVMGMLQLLFANLDDADRMD